MINAQTYTALLRLKEPWCIGRIDMEVTAEEVHVLVYGRVYAPSEDYNQRGRTSCPYTK